MFEEFYNELLIGFIYLGNRKLIEDPVYLFSKFKVLNYNLGFFDMYGNNFYTINIPNLPSHTPSKYYESYTFII